jgi:hypothetical protein
MKFFAKINFPTSDVQSLQENVAGVLDSLVRVPVIDGVHVTATLASGSNRIAQTLQRIPQGWIIVDRDSAATVYRTAWDSKTMTLTASGAVTIKMWVY